MKPLSFCLAAILAIVPVVCFAASPYAGEQSRSIKSLSKEDVADYIDGKGMGFAKAAELNGYPGPKHVLELAEQLALLSEMGCDLVQGYHLSPPGPADQLAALVRQRVAVSSERW